ncbi:hypothetical protein NVV94_02565 [Pseudomonas sp. LS1212]|uniref:hypothetical protein n=1 Tax=Pseudomonas sp. LS1212 TaxID=2972478 RepID=UPI00215D2252|nr:hypothetical protein [Pseudomonas sp. LS1212]UVJ44510.1 hypothetical protein NVV94_02565 [Pseudomonas sp. LS1212]
MEINVNSTPTAGVTKFDNDSAEAAVLKFFIPLWSPIEDIIQGHREGDQQKIYGGVLGLSLDILSFSFPFGKALSRIGKSLQSTWNAGFRSTQPTFRSIGQKLVTDLLSEFNVLLAPYQLTKTTFFGALKLSRPLRSKLNTHLSRLRVEWRGRLNSSSGSLCSVYAKDMSRAQGYYHRKLNADHRVVAFKHESVFYRVDGLSKRPFGASLMEITTQGKLSRQRPPDIPLVIDEANWKFNDSFPNLEKTVIYWGDEIYLKVGSTLYKKTTLATTRNVWRRTPGREVNRLNLPPLQVAACRVKRGQDLQVCRLAARNRDYVDVSTTNTQGAAIVPWFLNRSIEAATGTRKLVHNSRVMRIDGNRLKDLSPSATPLSYKDTLQATLLGGNDVFKQIRISGGIVDGIADIRTISAIIAKQRTDNALVLVTRADNNTYYRAAFTQGSAAVELRRMQVRHIETADDLEKLTEDDYLVLIHNGAYDAHYQMQKTNPAVLATHRQQITEEIASGRLPELGPAPDNPFEMGTDLVEAALFCKYTQFRFYLGLRSRLRQWGGISNKTEAHTRGAIAGTLNDLTQSVKYSADSVLSRHQISALAGQKNYAFLKIEFKNGDPSRTYFSISGKRKQNDYMLPLAVHIDKETPASGWVVERDNAISPTGERYIDAQPKAGLNEPPETLVSIPATPSLFNTKVIDGTTNLRELDTERLIIARMEQDKLDYSKVKSMLLFSKYPTCYSCTRLIDSLNGKLPAGALEVFEGPQKSPR